MAALTEPGEPGWMRHLLPVYRRYIYRERVATAIQWFEPRIVPGLLQTAAYARAHARTALPNAGADEIDARVRARLWRQSLWLDRNRAPDLSVTLTEAALRQHVSDDPNVQAEQLAHLTARLTSGLDLRVLPFRGGAAYPGMCAGSYEILHFPDGPNLVYEERHGGSVFIDSKADLDLFDENFRQLQSIALGARDTLALINQVQREDMCHG